MDDSCAVCAETLQWVAYGPCGHREVCSTCVVRLRFICSDYHCCICKSMSNIIFVTKALGDHTRIINDFSVFPVNPTEGQVGSYWYHEGTEAYFDDSGHYKMVKAMCRLSCGVCDKINEQKIKGAKRTAEFKDIKQLESHLFHRHGLFMCSLCLEGRKIFICEQKLYKKAQLNQHIKTGDSVIDGNECERGGFTGHPMCEFCKNPFYGDNELYSHMSREHYTCHICQRQHTGQYEYYKDYDDLEIHFRQEHFLCENGVCLAKKFVVFATESEMKRHNAVEHRGCISLYRCNAPPQIATSFCHHQSNEYERQGRECGYYHDALANQPFWASRPSFRTVIEEETSHTSSTVWRFNKVKMNNTGSNVNSFDTLANLQSEPSLRSSHALGQNLRNGLLEESSFPPLPAASRSNQHKLKYFSDEMSENTMAACLQSQNHRTVVGLSSQAQHISSHQSTSSASNSHWPSLATYPGSRSISDSTCSSQSKSATVKENIKSGSSNSSLATLTANVDVASSLRNSSDTVKASHSASASNPVNIESFKNSTSKFPSISGTVNNEVQSSGQPGVKTAKKLLVEKIRSALGFDDNKFTAFREASAGYHQGTMSTGEFLAKVHGFGLSHLTLELARLCPDTDKQKDLIKTYNYNMGSGQDKIRLSNDVGLPKKQKNSGKGKEKYEEGGINFAQADNSISCVSNLHSKCKPSDKEVKILSEYENSSVKGKSKVLVDDDEADNSSSTRLSTVEQRNKNVSQSGGASSKKNLGNDGGGGGNKQQKKIPKFLRNRLGNDAAALRY